MPVLEMKSRSTFELCNNDDPGVVDAKPVKLEPDLVGRSIQNNQHTKSKIHCRRQCSEENRSSSALSTGQSGTSVLDQEQSPVDNSSPCSTSPICVAPVCRQFWKAGNYKDGLTPKSTHQSGSSYLHIHPKFLHSNATSHKWAFGAIAELLDNAVDEIQNGATFVFVDKTSNPRNGSPALLIQDDGGGMDPDAMRRCLSFGFSDKKSKLAIGQYGNGFKTSSMRLGGDVIVFSRSMTNRKLIQSVGLLSYTFLIQAGYDRIVVPMVNYEFNMLTGSFISLHSHSNEDSNLSILLQWSPYSTEEELLKQFDDVGAHGTKIIIYNLWHNDDGTMELDFESDPEDIRIAGEGKSNRKDGSRMAVSEQHLANRLRYSLRAYLSILYLRIPENFVMLLRGRVVEYHNIASDLMYPECILYKPQTGGCVEGQILTTIGFVKEAPIVNVHGFNVYHKNRLILPFWRVVTFNDSRGRGVVGVLEANFIEPTHSKQDFEKTSVFQKLENRLKEMTWEYWDHHCGLIGYQVKKKQPSPQSQGSLNFVHQHDINLPGTLRKSSTAVVSRKAVPASWPLRYQAVLLPNSTGRPEESIPSFHGNLKEGSYLKRKELDQAKEPQMVKRKAGMGATVVDAGSNLDLQPDIITNQSDEEAINVMQENQRLRSECLDFEKMERELSLKVDQLRTELREAQGEYAHLLAELRLVDGVKGENNVLHV